MENYKKEFIEFMIDCNVLKFGDFVTKSGRKTPFFVNTGFYRTGAQLKRLGEYYAEAINTEFGLDFDVLFGPAYKGIPLTVATTMSIAEMFDEDINRRTLWALVGNSPIRQHINTIVDYSMYWVIGILNHYRMTGDEEFGKLSLVTSDQKPWHSCR